MILKLTAYQDEFYEEQDKACVVMRTDEVGLSEVIEVLQDFLEAVGFSLPDGVHLGYESDD